MTLMRLEKSSGLVKIQHQQRCHHMGLFCINERVITHMGISSIYETYYNPNVHSTQKHFYCAKISACAWLTPTDHDNFLECGDGTFCNVDSSSQGWSCCKEHGGRKRCPKNQPVMCVGKTCGGGADHCCSNDCFDSDGPRPCGMFIMLYVNIFPLNH